ncbi:outer membrane beta-barrel protein [Psychroserpens sp.]
MKKLYFVFIFILCYISINAQLDVNYGIKMGVNYGSSGDLSRVGGFSIPELPSNFKSSEEIGYSLGFYAQADISKIFIRTELLFSKLKTSYTNIDSEYDNSILELPVLLGYKLLKPFSLYAGPSLQLHLNNDLDAFRNVSLEIDKNLVLGFNIGGMIEIKKIGIDLRYTSNFSKNKAINIDAILADGIGYIIDAKSNQFMLSVSYKLN